MKLWLNIVLTLLLLLVGTDMLVRYVLSPDDPYTPVKEELDSIEVSFRDLRTFVVGMDANVKELGAWMQKIDGQVDTVSNDIASAQQSLSAISLVVSKMKARVDEVYYAEDRNRAN